MDETKKRYVPAWVRDDPEVLADWLSIDWEAEAKLYEEMGRRPLRENQVVLTGRSNRAPVRGLTTPKDEAPDG